MPDGTTDAAAEGDMRSPQPPGASVTLAVVGLGYWGPNRLRVLVDNPDVLVRRICDADEERLSHFARRYPAVIPSRDFQDVIDDPEVDAVVIATPVFTHSSLVARALEAGKHVFVEKPLAASSGEAQYLIDRAESSRRLLMCGHTFLYSPPVRAVKEMIDEGALGDLHYISSSRVNLGPYRSDVSVIFDLGPHDFSMLLYWLGALPVSVTAVGRDVISEGISDVAFVSAVFPDGVVANVELSWLAPSKLRRTVLVGSEKMLVYEDGSPEPIRLYDSGIDYRDPETFGEYHLAYRTGEIVSPRVDSAEPIALELSAFTTAITGGPAPAGGMDLALDILRMVEAAEASLNSGGKPVAAVPSGALDRTV